MSEESTEEKVQRLWQWSGYNATDLIHVLRSEMSEVSVSLDGSLGVFIQDDVLVIVETGGIDIKRIIRERTA